MIKNERQYRITRTQAEKFKRALEQLAQREAERSHIDPLLRQAEEDGMRSILADLRAELSEYEALKSGAYTVLECDSFEELPRALIRARIASGLSQKELAERLGVREQQVQHYEATEYRGASFSRLMEVVQALNVKVQERIFLQEVSYV